MGILFLVDHFDTGELDVEKLVDGIEHPDDAHLILELDDDLFADQRFEERIEQLHD